VLGVGEGAQAHPVWPDVYHRFAGVLSPDGSWVAWRLTGGNHRELGRSARVFPNVEQARDDALMLHERISEAEAVVSAVPHTTAWGWQLHVDDTSVATSSRGFARHRECVDNVVRFSEAAEAAELAELAE
jgi:hypothetical protein